MLDACELEYIAENEYISVIPKFSGPPIELLGGTVGPFKAGLAANVPLWLAFVMKQHNRAHIIVPDWMTLEEVCKIKDNEFAEDVFTQMPNPYWMVIAKMLFKQCSEDIPNAERVHFLLQEIWDRRQFKFRKSAEQFIQKGVTFASLPNCTIPEILLYRNLLTSFVEKTTEFKDFNKNFFLTSD